MIINTKSCGRRLVLVLAFYTFGQIALGGLALVAAAFLTYFRAFKR